MKENTNWNNLEPVIELIEKDMYGLWDKYDEYLSQRCGGEIRNGDDLVELMENRTHIEDFARFAISEKYI